MGEIFYPSEFLSRGVEPAYGAIYNMGENLFQIIGGWISAQLKFFSYIYSNSQKNNFAKASHLYILVFFQDGKGWTSANNNHETLYTVYSFSVSHDIPSSLGFYDSVGFTQLQVIPDYYYISFHHAAAVLCCSYVNGGQPFPHTFSSYFQRYVVDSWCCRLLSELGQWLVKLARGEDLEQTGSMN